MPGPVPEWRQAPRIDLLAIIDYIADDSPAAAQALKDDIEAKVSALPDHPKLYRSGRIEGTREMVVRGNYLAITQKAKLRSLFFAFFMGRSSGLQIGAEPPAFPLRRRDYPAPLTRMAAIA